MSQKTEDRIKKFNETKNITATILSLLRLHLGHVPTSYLKDSLKISDDNISMAIQELQTRGMEASILDAELVLPKYSKSDEETARQKRIIQLLRSNPAGISKCEIESLFRISETTYKGTIRELKNKGFSIISHKRKDYITLENGTEDLDNLIWSYDFITREAIESFYVLSSIGEKISRQEKCSRSKPMSDLAIKQIKNLSNLDMGSYYLWEVIDRYTVSSNTHNEIKKYCFLHPDSKHFLKNNFPFIIQESRNSVEDYFTTLVTGALRSSSYGSTPNQIKRLVGETGTSNNRQAEDLYKMCYYMNELISHNYSESPLCFQLVRPNGEISALRDFCIDLIGYSQDSGKAFLIGHNVKQSSKESKLTIVRLDSIVWHSMEASKNTLTGTFNEFDNKLISDIKKEMFDISTDSPSHVKVLFDVDKRLDVIEDIAALSRMRETKHSLTYFTSNGIYDSREKVPESEPIHQIIYEDDIRGLGSFSRFLRQYSDVITILSDSKLENQFRDTVKRAKECYSTIDSLKNDQPPIVFSNETDHKITITYGEKHQSIATGGATENIKYQIVRINEFDPEIARINSFGVVTPMRAGTVIVRAISEGNESYKPTISEYELTIHKKNQTVSFKYDSNEIKPIYVGETFHNPFSHESLHVTYIVEKGSEKLIRIDNDGFLTAISSGEATIIAIAEEDDRYNYASAQYTITILEGRRKNVKTQSIKNKSAKKNKVFTVSSSFDLKNPTVRIGHIIHSLLSLDPDDSTTMTILSFESGIPLDILRNDIYNMCRFEQITNFITIWFQTDKNSGFHQLEYTKSNKNSELRIIKTSTLHKLMDLHLYDDYRLKATLRTDATKRYLILNREERKALTLSPEKCVVYRNSSHRVSTLSTLHKITYDFLLEYIAEGKKRKFTQKTGQMSKDFVAQPISLYTDTIAGKYFLACIEQEDKTGKHFLTFREVNHIQNNGSINETFEQSTIDAAKTLLDCVWAPERIEIKRKASQCINNVELLINGYQQNALEKIKQDVSHMHSNNQFVYNSDGSVILRTKISSGMTDFKKWILSYGSSITVTSPPKLREEISGIYLELDNRMNDYEYQKFLFQNRADKNSSDNDIKSDTLYKNV